MHSLLRGISQGKVTRLEQKEKKISFAQISGKMVHIKPKAKY